MNRAAGSFRDPCGYVYENQGSLFRCIGESYRSHWEKSEPFLQVQVQQGRVVPFEPAPAPEGFWKAIQLERLPFISFPYEWSFHQLKDAALLTLALHRGALASGLILKDASAFNIQFYNTRPVFIDHLSFEVWEEGKPWSAYRQFCTHFLAPLCVMAYTDIRCGTFAKNWLDGIPLDIAAAMLPFHKRLRPGLLFHLFLHARLQRNYGDSQQHAAKVKKARVSLAYLDQFAASLERLISSIRPPSVRTEWSDYYADTNYTAVADDCKMAAIARLAQEYSGGFAVDLGANTGKYTQLLAPYFPTILAADIDPLAVDNHYSLLRKMRTQANIVPLLMDISNPSPALGFHCKERPSFIERCSANFIIALAFVHHLRITAGIPLQQQTAFFADLVVEDGVFVLEFVPKDDSQTERLLAAREDIFSDYTLEQCKKSFSSHFICIEEIPVAESTRCLLVFKKRGSMCVV